MEFMYLEGGGGRDLGCHGDSLYSVFSQGMDIQSAENVQWRTDDLNIFGPSKEGHPKGESLTCPCSLFHCRTASTTLSCQRQGFCPKTCAVSFRRSCSEGRGPGDFSAMSYSEGGKFVFIITTFGACNNIYSCPMLHLGLN